MSTEANKQQYRRLIDEAFNQGKLDLVDELTTEDFVEHEQMDPSMGSGREAAVAMMHMIRGAFSDLTIDIGSMGLMMQIGALEPPG